MSKTSTQFYNEVRKLHFDQCVHLIGSVLSKILPVTYGIGVASDK